MKNKPFSLQPFQKNSFLSDLNITGSIARRSDILSICYKVQGRLSEICLPEITDTPARKNNLWENTCFEFFLAVRDLPPYWEFNLSPSGDWNVYYFQGYRAGMKEEMSFSSLPFVTRRDSELFLLDFECDLERIVDKHKPIEIAISAVIKYTNNNLSYRALTHCGSKADFHLRDSFMIKL